MRIAICLLLLSFPLLADETKLSPKEAWTKMQQEVRDLRQMRTPESRTEARNIQRTRPKEFLRAWEEGANKATGEELFFLAHFFNGAQRPLDAMNAYGQSATTAALPPVLKRQAMTAFARAMTTAMYGEKLLGQAADAAIKQATAFRDALTGDETLSFRGPLSQSVGTGHELRGRGDQAIDAYMRAAREQPSFVRRVYRSVIACVINHNTDLAAYDGMRERGAALKTELIELQNKYIEELKAANNQRMLSSANRTLAGMEKMTTTLEMLGKPAPAWTLKHAFADTKTLADLKGKVVLVDFWATWCPWCIRSFPALRDLLKDYKDKPFTVVGVTATAGYVWKARYDLDDDLKDRGARTPPDLRMPRAPKNPGPEADDDAKAKYQKELADYEAAVAAFPAKEKEIIAEFIKNHEMTWPTVMIDNLEPGTKYALTGWPHAVVLDKQGRVRAFKRGALLRDRKEGVKKARKVLERLMAE